LQRLEVKTAHFAGDVAGGAHRALKYRIHNLVGVFDFAQDKRLSDGISTSRRVGVEIVISDAWTPIGKPVALNLV